MGLDMNVFRVHKPFLDANKVYDRSELSGIILDEADIKEPMFRQLAPYCTKVRVVNHYYDLEQIGKDRGLTDVRVGGWSCGDEGSVTYFSGRDKDGRSESVQLSYDLIKSKYTISKEETCYVCAEDEIRYWRKAYDIQDWFHEHIKEPVENTGYYILTEKMLKAFNKKFPEDKLPAEAPNDSYAFVYREWY